ncbi:hypothetical protein GE09DRAFT_979465, partial [Coniochaeta sp. 2T2.1]
YSRVIYSEADFNNGTFGRYYIGKEGYVHRIPDAITSEDAAPLQCAGATVYSALVGTVKPRDRVGVIGIGGLGHLAIQFAAKMGAEVVVFSSSADKEGEARSFGAKEFVLINEPEKVSAPVETLVLTSSYHPDWDKYATKKVLARDGTIIPLTVPPHGPLSLPAHTFFWEVYHLKSSLVASKADHRDMLEFAARHDIKALTQKYKLEGPETIDKIFKDIQSNKVRYRAVLEL